MSLTAPKGFRAAGVAAGIKENGDKDLTLVVNDGPLDVAAGVFTRNEVKAAPVLWSQQVLATGRVKAVVLNSGGANACTGPDGFQDTHRTAEHVAETLGIGAIDVAVCSTGRRGARLPMDRLTAGVTTAAARLDSTPEAGRDAAEAVMTADTFDKQARTTHMGWTIGGFAKGAGMCVATMLSVLTTDAVLDQQQADSALRRAVSTTFDGGTSTNDTVLLLCSGASGLTPGEDFTEKLTEVWRDLAEQLEADHAAEAAAT